MDLRIGVALYAAAWVTILWFLGLYSFRVRWTIAGELGDILTATFMLGFAMMTFLYLVKVDVSRLFLLLLLITQPLVTMAGRLVMRLGFNRLRTRGYNRCYMVIIGTGEEAQAFADADRAAPGAGHRGHRPPVRARPGRVRGDPPDPG